MSADDSFASLDLNSSQERAVAQTTEEEEQRRHLLGAPPDSYDDLEDDQRYGSDTGSYASGTSEYNLDDLPGAEYEVAGSSPVAVLELEQKEPEEFPSEMLVQPNERRRNDMKARKKEKYADLFMQVFLSSAMASCPLNLRDGFTPDEIDRALDQTMKIKLVNAGYAIMTENTMEKLPNNTNTEIAHALTTRKYLTTNKEGKFFPVISKDLEVRMAQTILGAEFCYRRSENKKREAEEYKTAESEIRAMWAFNMIVDLMKALMNDNKQAVVQYQTISTAFEKMVRNEMYDKIREKYDPYLNFAVTDKWNSDWYKTNTNRSALKKFVTMAKFSEIVALPSSAYKFRNHQSVRMFTVDDMKEVEDRFANGGNRYRGNYGRGGGNRSNGPPRHFPSKKKEIVPDPDYQPAATTDDLNDNGSLLPTSSSKPLKSFARQNSGGSRPGSPQRRSPQEGPSGRRSSSKDRQQNKSPSSPPINKFRRNDPFDGGNRRSGGDGFGGGGGRGGNDRDGFEGRNVNRRVDDIGDTSSESDETSDGEYSDEDDSAKNERIKKRAEKKAKKEAKRMNRKPKAVVQVDHSRNRFATSSFPSNQSETPVEPADTVRRTRPSTSSRASPRQESPHVPSDGSGAPTPLPTRSESPAAFIPPEDIPLVISSSTRDYRNANLPPSVPFQPTKQQLEENQKREQEKQRREQQEKQNEAIEKAMYSGSKMSSRNESTNRERESQRTSSTSAEQKVHPSLVQRRPQQQPQQQAPGQFNDPRGRSGFGRSTRMENRAGPLPPPPQSNRGLSPRDRGQDRNSLSQYNQSVPPRNNTHSQPYDGYHDGYQSTNQYDNHNHQSHMQQQRQHDSNGRRQYDNQSAPYDPYQQQGPPPIPSHSQNYNSRSYQPDNRQLQGNFDQHRMPNSGFDHQNQQGFRRESYAPQQQQSSQQSYYQNQNSFSPRPVFDQYGNDPYGYNQNNNQAFRNQPQPPMHQYDNREPYQPPTNHSDYGGNGGVVSRSSFPVLNSAGRLVQNVLRNQQGNPNGPQLMHEAIKYAITNHLIQSKNRQQPVFESDLRQMVVALGHGGNFDIVEFIRTEMRVSVAIEYNEQVRQFQFFSLM